MGFTWTRTTAITFCLTSIAVQSFGELIVLRHPPSDDGNARNLTCVSEDDDAALIWNLAEDDYADFQPKKPTPRNISDCAIWWDSTLCRAHWEITDGWEVVESAIRPMAPVFDFRWEDFEEFSFDKHVDYSEYQYVGEVNASSGSAVFSGRGTKNLFVLLCENVDPTKGPCFWIVLGGYEGKRSMIRYCANGAPRDKQPPRIESCVDISNIMHQSQSVLTTYEWHTYRLTWRSDTGTIQVISDTDNQKKVLLQGRVDQWPNVPHVSTRSDQGTRVRFHFYEYFLTEEQDLILYTEKFRLSDERFCAKLLVALCPECALNIKLVDIYGNNLESWDISGADKPVDNGLLTWQSVKLNARWQYFGSKLVRLEIQSIQINGEDNGQWAVDKIRMCRPIGSLRKSTIATDKKKVLNSFSWPTVNCQKLSYSKIDVVDSLSTNMINGITRQSQQFVDQVIRKFDESCGSECTSFGENWSLCSEMGCSCSRGFRDSDCGKKCADGYHGYNCEEVCGACDIGSCDQITGFCATGCESDTRLPPRCKTEIEKSTVLNITDTTATVLQKIELESDIVEASVEVTIQVEDTESGMNFTANLDDSGTYKAYLKNLKLDTNYTVYTIVSVMVAQQTISATSPEVEFTTTCVGEPDFVVTPRKNDLTVNLLNHEVCVNNEDPIYSVLVYDPANNIITHMHLPSSFPVIYYNLTPYTEYLVNVSNMGINKTMFSTKVRTLESAPSAVRNLRATFPGDTEVTLLWDPPLQKNGVIRNYNVSFTVDELLACEDFEATEYQQNVMFQTINDTAAKITGLHPYAKYTANVTAHTTESGEPMTVTFKTLAADIPTSKFSNLAIGNNNKTLYWDEPEDCTTITGPTEAAKLSVQRIGESARKFEATIQTNQTHVDVQKFGTLIPYTTYRVRIYVIRGYNLPANSTSYQELTWRTPPTAPPAVKDLEIYDADVEANSISLRWMPPSPANGEIESYRVEIIEGSTAVSDRIIKISEEGIKCELRDDYVCLENVKISSNIVKNNTYSVKVSVMNEGVAEAGEPKIFQITPEVYSKDPSEPKNLASIPQGHGIVMIKWSLPAFTLTKITGFYIRANQVSTKLRTNEIHEFRKLVKRRVESKQKEYSAELFLLPSTVYNVSIVSLNRRNITSTESKVQISVPASVAFASGEELRVKQIGASIEVQTPTVVNATLNTTVNATVKGLSTCTIIDSQKLSSPMTVTVWLAAVYKEEENKTRSFTIGDNNNHDSLPFNCSFHMGEAYVIELVATDWYSGTSAVIKSSSIVLKIDDEQSQDLNIVWIAIPSVLLLCMLLIHCIIGYRHFKRLAPASQSEEVIPLSLTAMSANDSTSFYTLNSLKAQSEAAENSTFIYTLPNEPVSCPVSTEDFEGYTEKFATSGLLYSQFKLLPMGLRKPCEYGRLEENMPKNRCKDLIAYDDTRVILEKLPGNPHSDYINANYIKGYKKERAYIAAQGPTPDTVNDFWRMIWQEEVQVICMLTNLIEDDETKCEKYWPDFGTRTNYGDIHVSNTDDQVFADYTFRIFELSNEQHTRKVTHLHYTGWPTLGVPAHLQSLLTYLKKLEQTPAGNGPIVVHCSTGDGRTGTIILCDICLRQAIAEKVIDVTAMTTQIRDGRANMVSTLQQFVLAHIIITESIVSQPTQIPCNELLLTRIEQMKTQLPYDIQRLNDTKWQEQALKLSAEQRPSTAEKLASDEVPDLVGLGSKLTVIVDVVTVKRQYLACSLLLPLTLSDFWGFIAERDVKLIIILQCSDPGDPTCRDIMPDGSIAGPVPKMQVENNTSLDEGEYFTNEKLLLTYSSEENARSRSVTVLTCKGWGYDKDQKPPTPAALISIWKSSENIYQKEGKTLVLCRNGITGCGLYLALSFLLERMTVERECDVISAVRAVRRSRSDFVESLEQFEYLYDAAAKYAE